MDNNHKNTNQDLEKTLWKNFNQKISYISPKVKFQQGSQTQFKHSPVDIKHAKKKNYLEEAYLDTKWMFTASEVSNPKFQSAYRLLSPFYFRANTSLIS